MRKILIILMTLSTGACCCDKEEISAKKTNTSASLAPVEYGIQNKAMLDLRVKDTRLAKPAVQEKAAEFSGYVDSESGSSIVAYVPADELCNFVRALNTDVGTVKNFKNADGNLDFTKIQVDDDKTIKEGITQTENMYSHVYIWLDDRDPVLRAFMSPMATIFGL